MGRRRTDDLRLMQDRLHDVLTQESDKRHLYDGNGWIIAERRVMMEAVNSERLKIGAPPVALADIERVEQFAVGHSDYGRKFALYCAELALGYRTKDIEP